MEQEYNKQEIIKIIKHVGEFGLTQSIADHLTDRELSLLKDLTVGVFVQDNSKVLWKKKAHFLKVFDVKLNYLYKHKILSLEDIGFMTVLASQIDYEDNILINKNNTYMTQNDIMNFIGWDRKRTYNKLKKMIDNEIIFKKKQENDKRKYKYYVNPNLYYKGQKIDKDMKKCFDENIIHI